MELFENAYIEITNKCNLRCKYCYNGKNHCQVEMDTNDFEKIVNTVKKYSNNKISISGGEPFLHSKISDIIDICHKNNIDTMILTNGTCITEKMASKIIKMSNIHIQISLDGTTEIVNDQIRLGGEYKKVKNTIEYLHRLGFNRGKIRMTLNRLNRDDVEGVFELAIKNCFLPCFGFVQFTGNAIDNKEELKLSQNDILDIRQKVKKLFEYYKKDINELSGKELTVHDLFGKKMECPAYTKGPIRPLIKVDGEVQFCQQIYETTFKLGNIFKTDAMEIFNYTNIYLNNVCEHINRLKELRDNKCRGCFLDRLCKKGCVIEFERLSKMGIWEENCRWKKRRNLQQLISRKDF